MKMTEAEARKIYRVGMIQEKLTVAEESFIFQLKAAGYITRPAWEEAEEKYQKWLLMPKDTVSDYYSMVDKFHDALTAAVERIKELEKKP